MSWLGPFYFDLLTHPWMLLLLIVVAILFVAELTARPHGAISVSTGDAMERARGSMRGMLRHLPAVLRAIALTLLVVALARPLNGMRPRVERAEVVDIILCMDASGSMTSTDFVVGGAPRDRLFVVKGAIRDFVKTRKLNNEDRFGMDRLGLVLYSMHAWMQCPLTLDYDVLLRELDTIAIDKNDEKSHRTAIGSGLGLSISRLNKTEAKSKVIILLTDGINNFGSLDPITAAQLAEDYGIRVYTIGAGSPEGGMISQPTWLGPRLTARATNPIDEESLRRIAEITGGKYYRATDTESLLEAYREINELETTEVDIGDAYDYEDGFMAYALTGGALMALSVFSRRRWFEAIP